MRRLSLTWEGELMPSPHGDLVEYREVFKLEEEIESLRKALQAEQERNAVLASRPVVDAQPAAAGGRLFGWVNPDDARRFNSGRKESCKVFKKRTAVFCMPLSNALGPNHYQKPPVDSKVTIEAGVFAVVHSHTPDGLCVWLEDMSRINVTKWSWNPCKS